MNTFTLTEKAWSQYEAEKAAGNAKAAEIIGDVYTTLDMLDMDEDAEQNRDYMEKTYYDMGKLCFRREGFKTGTLTEIWKGLEEKLVAVGILEPDEEPEEEEPEELDYTNDAQHWDEWAADQRFDMYRDLALMGYEY